MVDDMVAVDLGIDLRAIGLFDHLHRHLAGPEPWHLDCLGQLAQAIASRLGYLVHRYAE